MSWGATEQWNPWLEKAEGLEIASPELLLAETPGPDRTKHLSGWGGSLRHPDSALPQPAEAAWQLPAALPDGMASSTELSPLSFLSVSLG